ncbi:MAG: hypothetical protein WBA89_07775 [Microcoleus sp.]|uniref:hypothetical protein n=1 Tax=Microcoleus sp. TaxID=44472 RepID=UPI003C782079
MINLINVAQATECYFFLRNGRSPDRAQPQELSLTGGLSTETAGDRSSCRVRQQWVIVANLLTLGFRGPRFHRKSGNI